MDGDPRRRGLDDGAVPQPHRGVRRLGLNGVAPRGINAHDPLAFTGLGGGVAADLQADRVEGRLHQARAVIPGRPGTAPDIGLANLGVAEVDGALGIVGKIARGFRATGTGGAAAGPAGQDDGGTRGGAVQGGGQRGIVASTGARAVVCWTGRLLVTALVAAEPGAAVLLRYCCTYWVASGMAASTLAS